MGGWFLCVCLCVCVYMYMCDWWGGGVGGVGGVYVLLFVKAFDG